MPRGVSSRRGRPSAADIQSALRGVRYPAEKRDLMRAAQRFGVEDDILDMIDDLPDDEFGGPQEVMEEIFRGSGGQGSRGNDRGRGRRDPKHEIIDYLMEVGRAGEEDLEETLDQAGFNPRDLRDHLSELEDQGVCEEYRRGFWVLTEDQGNRSSGRGQRSSRREEGSSGGRSSYRSRGGAEDPDPNQVSSQRHSRISARDEERYRQRHERDDDPESRDWDRRLRDHSTDAIADARAMRHGYDGRGRVTDPDEDRRLGDHPSRAIDDARRMRHGYDGRGRVRKKGPGQFDEDIQDDYQRYLENRRRDQDEQEPDENGVYSRRRKFREPQGGRYRD